jgi:2-keto-4-pentenoate hydratase/2-oxohepta-3-ene-1,7-dioic acid hydratase in catechol pathway
MKLVSFIHNGRQSYGVLVDDGIVDAALVASDAGHTLREALERGGLSVLAEFARGATARIAPSDVQWLPVIPDPQKILCVGINYLTHVKETGREVPKYPMIFTRFADSQTAHDAPIVCPHASEQLDYEGELAVVIGRTARHVKAADALDYVAGYACYNDGSVRDWQKHTIQFGPGKNFPATGAFGPWLVSADEIDDPSRLTLTTRLNGVVVQEAGTDDLVFDVPALIEYCSTFTELNPGDVIITGTPGGVGAFRNPPLWMKPGDVVEVVVSGIGTLRNTIAHEARA